jgi:ferrous iron transport protein B
MTLTRLTIALAGNPNAGKTTIFNNITGTRQKVGNWPGVTVEKKEGRVFWNGFELNIVDLPGTYSLTPFSTEEIIARDFVLDEAPDVVVAIIDASNLERSLYLATQLRELDCKVVFALNMADLASSRGIKIDGDKLSELLDVPVVFTVGNKGQGVDALLKVSTDLALSGSLPQHRRRVRYSQEIEKSIGILQALLENTLGPRLPYSARWTAVKLIEDDAIIKDRLAALDGECWPGIYETTRDQREILRGRFHDDPEIITTDERYGFISGIAKEVLTTTSQQRRDLSRTIDLFMTNRYLGLPIFFLLIWGMFQLTFSLGQYPQDWIQTAFDLLYRGLAGILPDSLLKDLLLDGVVEGVGTVAVFLPNILILFLCIALFEDSGYMARAAFLMDKIMHLVGLHGKSFIPMLMGFGCNVPAIMASRTLESKTDRVLTILITPFMSCSAKLPVYIILAGAFFGVKAGTVIFAIYLTGIVVAIVTGRIFRSTLFQGADAPFVMELPPYRRPMVKSLLIHMWDRSKIFLRRMGGVILVGSVVIWTMANFPRYTPDAGMQQDLARIESSYAQKLDNAAGDRRSEIEREYQAELGAHKRRIQAEQAANSMLGGIGRAIAPVFAPIGIDWRGGIALLSGFVAKEIVVSTLGVLHAVTDEQGAGAFKNALMASGMTPLAALSMMVFVLLYLPCLATVSAIRRETGSLKYMLLSIVYSTSVAWIMAFGVYQGGRLISILF